MKLFKLNEALKFLAQSNEDLVLYLPRYEEDLHYRRLDDDGFYVGFQMPSKAAALTCAEVLHERFTEVNNEELACLIGEIMSLLMIMDFESIQAEYFWMVDKTGGMVTGFYDDFWSILRRLASQGLSMSGAEIRLPETPFGEFIKLAGFSRWRVVPASDD